MCLWLLIALFPGVAVFSRFDIQKQLKLFESEKKGSPTDERITCEETMAVICPPLAAAGDRLPFTFILLFLHPLHLLN